MSRLRHLLHERFGHPDFRPGQEPLVRAALGGRDALGVLPTGGGKSVCYMLPACLLDGTVLVVSPLVSLMEDQVVRARRLGLRAELLSSHLSTAERRGVVHRLRAGRLDLLLVAPERFAVPAFREAFEETRIGLVAVDEAHCISQWGHDFRPAYLRLGAVRRTTASPCMALTATATPTVRREIRSVLGLRTPEEIVGGFDRENLAWEVGRVRGPRERAVAGVRAVRRALRAGDGGSVVVYADTRRSVETIRDRLARVGLRAATYHAGMRASSRADVQEAFMEGRTPVVVATNAFGMGVDKPDVRLVLHWSLPGSLEAYYQEAGRAGRDGRPARCVALRGREDGGLHRAFLDRSRPPVRSLARLHRALRSRLPAGGRGEIDAGAVAAVLGRGWSPPGVEAAVRALEGAGLARVTPGSEGRVRLSLRPGRPDWRRARALRKAGLARLRAVRAYARPGRCRRRSLLAYFGQTLRPGPCLGCDVCGAPSLSTSR